MRVGFLYINLLPKKLLAVVKILSSGFFARSATSVGTLLKSIAFVSWCLSGEDGRDNRPHKYRLAELIVGFRGSEKNVFYTNPIISSANRSFRGRKIDWG